MHDAISDQISHIEQHLAMCKQKLRGLRGSRINQKAEEGSGDNFILFPHCQYPFLDDDKRPCKMLKTVINCDISNSKLQKLMRVNHPNIINIQKIARGHRTISHNTSSDVFYSFYFETVPYSLKKIITNSNSNQNLIFQLATLNFAKILRNVNGFLMKEGIYNLFKLEDIGITKEAELKIYISPLIVMGGLSLKMGNHKAVTASIDKLLGWWETSLASHEVIHPSNNRILMQIPEDLASEESVENNFRETI